MSAHDPLADIAREPELSQSVGMRSTVIIAVSTALLFPVSNVLAAASEPRGQDVREFELSKSYETSRRASDGSSGNSRGRDAILERVIAVRENGVELEYDLPKDATVQDRRRDWRFPARVWRSSSGTLELLNHKELQARVDGWLKDAQLTRASCGRTIFTWNAFRIECDPQSVITMLQSFDIASTTLHEGAIYRDDEARGPGTLLRQASGKTLGALMQIDPEAVHRAQAEADVTVGEIMGKPVTLDAALRERRRGNVSGTIAVTFEVDTIGRTLRRIKVTKLEIKRPDGLSETRTATETVGRRAIRVSHAP